MLISNYNAHKILNSNHYANAFSNLWDDESILTEERVYVIYLNYKSVHLCHLLLNIGGYSGTIINIRKAVHCALNRQSNHVLIAHNHTNGNPNPSQDDINVTNKLHMVCQTMEIKLVDHIILAHQGKGNGYKYYSFKDNGHLG